MKTLSRFNSLRRFDTNNPAGGSNNGDGGDGAGKTPDASKKYSQEDVNHMMATKAKETEAKVKQDMQSEIDQLKADFESKKNELIEEGKKRAGETASEAAQRKLKAQQEELDREKAEIEKSKAEQAKQNALTSTQSLLTKKGLPADFANYLADTDEDVRTNNVESFADIFKKQVDKAKDDALKGKSNPSTGNGAGVGSSKVTADDFQKMSLSDRMKFANDYPDDYKALTNK